MIFLTVGTHEPFERLVQAVDRWCRDVTDADVFGQITDPRFMRYRPQHFDWISRLSPPQYEARVRGSEFMISHAGVGSIMAAMSASKPIVVLPRRQQLHETRNDHQLATARRWQSRPGVHVAIDESELPEILNRVRAGSGDQVQGLEVFASDELTRSIKQLIQLGSNPELSRNDMSRRRSIL